MQAFTSTKRRAGGIPYKWIVVIVVLFGSFMAILDQTIVNNALPRLQSAFGVDFNSLQWIITAYTLTQGVVTPTTAFFANRLGTKRFYVIALAFFTLGSALCGLAWNLPVLIFFRIVQAIGGAALFPLAITLLFTEFPPHQRGLATGILGISALMAPAIGPTLGGYIVTYANWPLIFYVNVPVGIIGIILALLLLREHTAANKVSFDLPGFIFAALGLTALLYSISNATIAGWGSPSVLSSLIGGLCALLLFVFIELNIARRGKQPLVDVRLFANGPFLCSNIANALISFGFFGSLILFPIYTQNLRGLDAFHAGLVTLPLGITSMLAAIIGGRIVDRFGPRVVLFPGLVFLVLSTWQLAQMTQTTSYTWFVLIMALRGLGLGCLLQPLTVSALTRVPQAQYTQASSLNTVVRFVFTSLGIAILATVVQSRAAAHSSDLVHQLNPTTHATLALIRQHGLELALQDAFWIGFVAFFLAFFAIAFLRVQRHRIEEKSEAVEPAAAQRQQSPALPSKRSQFAWTGFSGKTLWDWLQLLAVLAIPLVIVGASNGLGNVQYQLSDQQHQIDQKLADKQHQANQLLADDQQQEVALKAYLDDMSTLLLTYKLSESIENDEVRQVAQAKTLTVLRKLNGTRKGSLIQFLYEAQLINGKKPIIRLTNADLSRVELRRVDLHNANLSGAYMYLADFSGAYLPYAILQDVTLSMADLSGAMMSHVDLSNARLDHANLQNANLSGANLSGTVL